MWLIYVGNLKLMRQLPKYGSGPGASRSAIFADGEQ
jgi:hypothetical protein